MSTEPSKNEAMGTHRPQSIVLPVFEIDCSGWLSDTVPQECGPIFQRSVLIGPADENASEGGQSLPASRRAEGDDLAAQTPDVGPINRWIDMLDRDLQYALSELTQEGNRTNDSETEELLRATTRDLLEMTQSLAAARSRLKSLQK